MYAPPARSLAPKGRSITAQGNALGHKERSRGQALKGRANKNPRQNRRSRRTVYVGLNQIVGRPFRAQLGWLGHSTQAVEAVN